MKLDKNIVSTIEQNLKHLYLPLLFIYYYIFGYLSHCFRRSYLL